MEPEKEPPQRPTAAKGSTLHVTLDDVVAALKRLLSMEGRACVSGTEIRFMQMGEVIEGDTGSFRAKESGVFVCGVNGGTWKFLGRFDQFEDVVRPLLERLSVVQHAVILLRAAIHDGSTTLSEMDKEIEADLERLLAGIDQARR